MGMSWQGFPFLIQNRDAHDSSKGAKAATWVFLSPATCTIFDSWMVQQHNSWDMGATSALGRLSVAKPDAQKPEWVFGTGSWCQIKSAGRHASHTTRPSNGGGIFCSSRLPDPGSLKASSSFCLTGRSRQPELHKRSNNKCLRGCQGSRINLVGNIFEIYRPSQARPSVHKSSLGFQLNVACRCCASFGFFKVYFWSRKSRLCFRSLTAYTS